MRELIINRFCDNQDFIYPFNEYIAHLILTKDFSTLKTFSELKPSTSLSIEDYRNLISSIPSSFLASAREYLNTVSDDYDPAYIFIGSKSNLKSLIFYDFLPSAFDACLSYLTSSFLKQVGSGHGSAFIISPSFFNSDFSDYSNVENHSLILLDQLSQVVKNLQKDNDCLIDVLSKKDQHIQSLLQIIEELQYEKYMSTQMTWR